jgi:hypothetical protein
MRLRIIDPLEFAERYGWPVVGMLVAAVVLVAFDIVRRLPLPEGASIDPGAVPMGWL